MRLPSAAFGTLSIWLIKRVGERLGFSQPIVFEAAVLMALAPFQIHYSQEARMYELLQALILLSVWAALGKCWMALGPIWATILYTHNLGALYTATLGLLAAGPLVWGRRWRELLSGPLLSGGVAGVLYLPWAAVLLSQMRDVGDGFWVSALSPGAFALSLYEFIFFTLLPGWAELQVAVLIFILTILATWRGINDKLWATLALVWGPILLASAISIAWRPVFLVRTLIGAIPFFYLLLTHFLASLPQRRQSLAWGMLVVGMFIGVAHYECFPAEARPNSRDYPASILAKWQAGDAIYHMNLASYILYSYYTPGKPNYVWPQAGDLSQSLTTQTQEAMGIKRLPIEQIPARRIWLLWVDNPHVAQTEINEARRILTSYRAESIETLREDEFVSARVWLVELDDAVGSNALPR